MCGLYESNVARYISSIQTFLSTLWTDNVKIDCPNHKLKQYNPDTSISL